MSASAGSDDTGKDGPAGPDRANRKVAQIMAAARGLFIEHNFEAVSMDQVTRASGVSKATLYVHFASKEALFSAVIIEETRRAAEDIWAGRQDGDDLVTVLRRVARNFVDVFMSERALLLRRAIVSAVPRMPAIGHGIYALGPALLKQRVSGFLAEADKDGLLDVANPDLAANQFLSLVRGDIDVQVMMALDPPSPAEIDLQIDEGIALFLARYGRAAPPGPSAR